MEINGMGLLGVSLASYTLGYMLCWHTWRKDRVVAKATVDKASKSLAKAYEVLMEQRDLIQTQREFTDYLKGQADGMLAQRNAVAENLRFERQLHEQTQAKLREARNGTPDTES